MRLGIAYNRYMGTKRQMDRITSDVRSKDLKDDELLFSQIMEQAGIEYEYEPHRFNVGIFEHNEKTKNRSFQPDFFLPTQDLYVELTNSQDGGMNMDLKLRKIQRLKDGQGDKRVCILNGQSLRWFLKNGMDMDKEALVKALEQNYEHTCKKAGIRTREESIMHRMKKEMNMQEQSVDSTEISPVIQQGYDRK